MRAAIIVAVIFAIYYLRVPSIVINGQDLVTGNDEEPHVPLDVCPDLPSRSLSACLANSAAYLRTLDWLYGRHASDIIRQRSVMRSWCNRTNSCKFCDEEVEMLFMLLRELKPDRVFEMSPNRGYSTNWILRALDLNKKGHLHSIDIHNASVMHVPANPRWSFEMVDGHKWIKSHSVDPFDVSLRVTCSFTERCQ